MSYSQAILTILSALAIWFSQGKSLNDRRYGSIFGLASQPFWIYETTIAHQYGMLLLSFFYTYAWSRGIWNFWFKSHND